LDEDIDPDIETALPIRAGAPGLARSHDAELEIRVSESRSPQAAVAQKEVEEEAP
jgi:hypothetical protein